MKRHAWSRKASPARKRSTRRSVTVSDSATRSWACSSSSTGVAVTFSTTRAATSKARSGSDRYRAPDVISNNMRDGRIGLRTGAGFLDYSGLNVDDYREKRLAELVNMLRHFGLWRGGPPVL